MSKNIQGPVLTHFSVRGLFSWKQNSESISDRPKTCFVKQQDILQREREKQKQMKGGEVVSTHKR